ncbi:ABC transporter permease [Subtercola sp. YIM 133946]|uniref:ABC transporter permease n=1 Tax=Subtercola sp. YIM 133946 TaxID=3118909 RepID=UPI002F923940
MSAGRAGRLQVLVRQRLRRDRAQLLIWVLGTGVLAAGSVASVVKTYGTPQDRAGILQVAVANPTILVLRGLPDGTSTGGFAFFELFAFLAVLAGLMSTFLVVRHTRAEEETGRAELIASTPAARTLPTVATVIVGVLANVALGVVVALAFLTIGVGSGTSGADVAGSLLTGAALAGVGIFFVGAALLVAQVMRTSRGANGVAAALVGAAYLLAGIGNAVGALGGATGAAGIDVTSAWPSWLSPIGWGHQVHPFTTANALPLLLDLAGAAVLVASAFAVQASRDSGASLLGARAARASARRLLASPLALAWRLQWPTIVGWAVGGAALGALVGALGPAVQSAVNSDAAALRQIGGGDPNASIVSLFVRAVFSIIGVLAAGSAVQAVIRLRQEQTAGTAELVLAARVSRATWMLGYLIVGTVAVIVVLGSAALVAAALLGADAGPAGATPGSATAGDVFGAALAQLTAALLYLGGLALVFSLVPRATIAVGWGALAAGTALGLYGALLGIPQWLRDVSPFAHSPAAASDWSGGYWMLALAALAAAGAAAVIRRREVV